MPDDGRCLREVCLSCFWAPVARCSVSLLRFLHAMYCVSLPPNVNRRGFDEHRIMCVLNEARTPRWTTELYGGILTVSTCCSTAPTDVVSYAQGRRSQLPTDSPPLSPYVSVKTGCHHFSSVDGTHVPLVEPTIARPFVAPATSPSPALRPCALAPFRAIPLTLLLLLLLLVDVGD